jgi:ABC-2 type transport system permease protein
MTFRWIALRVMQEIVRDRRTLVFFFLVPVIVMTLVYFAIYKEEVARVAVAVPDGAAELAQALEAALAKEPTVRVVPFTVTTGTASKGAAGRVGEDERIRAALRSGVADGVLYVSAAALGEQMAGQPSAVSLYLEGTRPTLTAALVAGVSHALATLALEAAPPADPACPAECAGRGRAPVTVQRVYLHAQADYRLIDFFLPVLLPFFVFFFTFMVSTITFQRERTRGTLERLLIAPLSFTQVVLGYVAGFFIFTSIQMAIVLAYILVLITFPVTLGQVAALVGLSLLVMLIALLLGLLVSFVAHSEFQAVQFIPLVILPQIFLSDLIWTLDSFPAPFRWIAALLPLTHANALTRDLLLKQIPLWENWGHLTVLGGYFLVTLALLGWSGRRAHGMFS